MTFNAYGRFYPRMDQPSREAGSLVRRPIFERFVHEAPRFAGRAHFVPLASI